MVPASMMCKQSLFEKSVRFANLVDAALCRVNAHRSMTILEDSADGTKTRVQVSADFKNAAKLKLFDKHILPRVIEVLDEAEKHDMTAIKQIFTQESLYAIRELGSVAAKDRIQISRILRGIPEPVMGQVFAFKPCQP